jgi:DNA circularisation protein N-terminus
MARSACALGKDYVVASFKGVEFYSTESDIEGGRRGAEAEYPFGENTNYADLGRKIRVAHITAVFREDDHIGDAQALFNACESPGPGMLVHPTRGSFMAACRSVKVKDNAEEQGETTAELEFVEANEVGAGGSLGSLFGIIATGLNAASQGSFIRDYQPALVSQPWRAEIINTAQRLVEATAQATTRSLPADAPAQAYREVLKMEDVAKDNGLAASGAKVDKALSHGFLTIPSNLADPDKTFELMRRLANAAAKTSVLPAGAESEEAVISRHRVLAAIDMAEAAMGRKYATVDNALVAKDQVLAVLDDEAEAAYAKCDNALFLELKNYAIQFAQMMHDLTYRLPGRIIVDFMGGVHPLVAAYAIYNDAKRHRELEQHNVVDANGRFKPLVVAVAPQ